MLKMGFYPVAITFLKQPTVETHGLLFFRQLPTATGRLRILQMRILVGLPVMILLLLKQLMAGNNWTLMNIPGHIGYDYNRGIHFYSQQNGIVITQGGLIYKTVNGGNVGVYHLTL